MTDFTPVDLSEPEAAPPARVVPPPTGYGTDADSLVSVKKLVLSPPRRVPGRHMPKNPTQDDGSCILRFLAELDSEDDLVKGREFILRWALAARCP
jgi:hypothetical protein